MRVWAPCGQTPVVKADPGRECTHFYGALDLLGGEEVVLRADLMTAEVSALFLTRLLLTHPDVPIRLLWDRAPWHRGAAIEAVLAANPRLQILWLPTASPELNPQEQVWKATRKAVSHNHTYAKLGEVATAFEEHLTRNRFPCALLELHDYHNLCARFT